MEQMALQNGGPDRVKDMIGGKGIGLILKTLSIQYRVRSGDLQNDTSVKANISQLRDQWYTLTLYVAGS